MPQSFLTVNSDCEGAQAAISAETPAEPGKEKVVITVRGASYAVERVVHELYRVGFAEVGEWCKPQPTGKVHEVIRVLTRYVIVE